MPDLRSSRRAGSPRRLLMVGGGHAHALALRDLARPALSGVDLTLVSPQPRSAYSGMLPGLLAGFYRPDEIHIDLSRLARRAGARLLLDEMTGLDPNRRQVFFRSGRVITYDLLSLNIGAQPDFRTPGAAEHTFSPKPIDRFLEEWRRILADIPVTFARVRFAVVGGGAAGVELALAMQYALSCMPGMRDRRRPDFHLFTGNGDLLAEHNPGVRRRFRHILARRGIQLHTGHRVRRVREGLLEFEGAPAFACDAILWAAGAAPPPWLADSGLTLDPSGFLLVKPTLQSVSHPYVFAAGDMAAVAGYPRPKAGVFAVRQGPPLARNLRRVLGGLPPEAIRPGRRFLSLVATGNRSAVASWGGWSAGGRLLWAWKDRIDRRFMARFS